ncbi:hypothetical protein LCGC14_1756000 [marine sediment metagenome]|uniref:Uncharacterized protein n=1 Tax=marine sediment metagenome TaxID=412755 RepID=A0A0F9JHM7_9ZZZZ
MSDVTLTVEVVTENLDALKDAEKGVGGISDSVIAMGKAFEKANPHLAGNVKQLELVKKGLQDIGAGAGAIAQVDAAITKAGGSSKEFAKEVGEISRKLTDTQKSTRALAQGLTGLTR